MVSIDIPNEPGKIQTKREIGKTTDSLESAVYYKIIKDKSLKNQLRVLCVDDEDACERVSTDARHF